MALNIGDFPPRFLNPDDDLGNPQTVDRYYHDLEGRALTTRDALEQWLHDWSELDAWIDQEESLRHVAVTCQTDDPEKEKLYLDFIENVSPVAKAGADRLNRKLLAAGPVSQLDRNRYEVLLRGIRSQVEVFREENLPLQTEDDKLRQQYQKLVGCMSVHHDGEDRTLEQMARYLEDPDRTVRQDAWEKIAAVWRAARVEIDAIYDRMIAVRQKIAAQAGFANYRDYAFVEIQRFDYRPADCVAFADTIEQIIAPAAQKLAADRKQTLGLDRLRPWDMIVDPKGRPPLRPFEDAATLIERCAAVFGKVCPIFAEQFGRMAHEGLLDLESRSGKAPGGYMIVFEGRRMPFIFMNAVGTHNDVQTLLHEGGHAFHAFAVRDEPLLGLRDAPIEFAEVASMAMELLGGRYLEDFYSTDDARRARTDHLHDVVKFFPYMACIDMFQHWVYTHPGHTREDRAGAWTALNQRFNPWVDYGGYETDMAFAWHRKGHPFTVPFYYVEYGIAQLGSLGVWLNSQRDYPAAVAAYRRALALGGRRPLPELFAAADTRLDFSPAAVAPLIDAVMPQL